MQLSEGHHWKKKRNPWHLDHLIWKDAKVNTRIKIILFQCTWTEIKYNFLNLLTEIYCWAGPITSVLHYKAARLTRFTLLFFRPTGFQVPPQKSPSAHSKLFFFKWKLINFSPSQKFYFVFQGRNPLKILSITEEQYTVYGAMSKLN